MDRYSFSIHCNTAREVPTCEVYDLKINNTIVLQLSTLKDSITFYLDPVQLVQFKNSVHQAYETYLRLEGKRVE